MDKLQENQKDIYIVIVTYNGMRWLPRTLPKTLPYSVVVIDNDSKDGTVDFIVKNFPCFTVIRSNENLGFGGANNLGIGYALKKGARHIFLLNQDAYLYDGCIQDLVNFQARNPLFGVLSPVHLDGEGKSLENDFLKFANKDFKAEFLLFEKEKQIYEVGFINAAGWILSRKCLLKVGGFDPIFFHYGEDDNFCQRVRFHGFKVGVVSGTFMCHDREQQKVVVQRGSNAYFLKKERVLKIKYADLNRDNLYTLRGLIKKFRIRRFKSFLKMNKKEFQYNRRYLNMLKKVLEEVCFSRKRNEKPGSHYLQ